MKDTIRIVSFIRIRMVLDTDEGHHQDGVLDTDHQDSVGYGVGYRMIQYPTLSGWCPSSGSKDTIRIVLDTDPRTLSGWCPGYGSKDTIRIVLDG